MGHEEWRSQGVLPFCPKRLCNRRAPCHNPDDHLNRRLYLNLNINNIILSFHLCCVPSQPSASVAVTMLRWYYCTWSPTCSPHEPTSGCAAAWRRASPHPSSPFQIPHVNFKLMHLPLLSKVGTIRGDIVVYDAASRAVRIKAQPAHTKGVYCLALTALQGNPVVASGGADFQV